MSKFFSSDSEDGDDFKNKLLISRLQRPFRSHSFRKCRARYLKAKDDLTCQQGSQFKQNDLKAKFLCSETSLCLGKSDCKPQNLCPKDCYCPVFHLWWNKVEIQKNSASIDINENKWPIDTYMPTPLSRSDHLMRSWPLQDTKQFRIKNNWAASISTVVTNVPVDPVEIKNENERTNEIYQLCSSSTPQLTMQEEKKISKPTISRNSTIQWIRSTRTTNLEDFDIPTIFSDNKNHIDSLEEVNKTFRGILNSSISISRDVYVFRCAWNIVTSFYEPFDKQIYPKLESNLQFDPNEKIMTNCFCNALNIIGEKSFIFIDFILDNFLKKTFLYLERLFQFVSKNIFAGRIAEVILYCLCNVLKDNLLKEDSYSDLLWKYFKNSISSKLIELGSAVLFCSFYSKSERLEEIKSILDEVYERNKEAKEYLGFSIQEIDDARKKK